MKIKTAILFIAIALLSNCTTRSTSKKVEFELPDLAVKSTDFEAVIDGKDVKLFNIRNNNGMIIQITNYGATLVSVILPVDNHKHIDVALGFKTLEEYRKGRMSVGFIVGRYANRIANGNLEIDGIKYPLEINQPPNSLHSGSSNYGHKVWDAEQDENTVRFSLLSPDMDGGFPGELKVDVTYTLTEDNRIEIIYEALTTKKTVINLTNHSLFNMAGEGSGDVLKQFIQVNADNITPVNANMIPTGELMPVEGTPFDLREEIQIGKMIDDDHEQLKIAKGYDHNWVLNKFDPKAMTFAASFRDAATGTGMKVYTTEPGIQIYTGNFMNGTLDGKSGNKYNFRNGVAFETQHFPDSPNHPSFPSTILEPGQKYIHKTVFEFIY